MKYSLHYILLIVASIGLLAITSCTKKTPADQPPQKEVTSDQTGTTTQTPRDTKSSQEYKNCIDAATNQCIQQVATNLAQQSRDTSFCEDLEDKDMQASCKFAVVIMEAQESGDIAVCKKLEWSQFENQCNMIVHQQNAISKNDVKICDNISNPKTTDTETSMLGIPNDREQCIINVVMSNPKGTEKDCDIIKDKSLNEVCKLNIKNRPPLAIPEGQPSELPTTPTDPATPSPVDPVAPTTQAQ